MGCGSSNPAAAAAAAAAHAREIEELKAEFEKIQSTDDADNAALASYLAAILDSNCPKGVIDQYVAALQSEGFDGPEQFDSLTTDELAGDPFKFKRGHLQKVILLLLLLDLIQQHPCILKDLRTVVPRAVQNVLTHTIAIHSFRHFDCRSFSFGRRRAGT